MTHLYFTHEAHALDERVLHILARHPHLGHLLGRTIAATIIDGTVHLTGRVGTYYQKQLAQESLRRLQGLTSINNQLEVVGN